MQVLPKNHGLKLKAFSAHTDETFIYVLEDGSTHLISKLQGQDIDKFVYTCALYQVSDEPLTYGDQPYDPAKPQNPNGWSHSATTKDGQTFIEHKGWAYNQALFT